MVNRQCVIDRRGWYDLFWLALIGAAVWCATTAPAAAETDVSQEIKCLALNIYFEARGEPAEGKIAVGNVVMNRVKDPRYPARVCDVIRQGGERIRNRCQFSWWCDGRSDKPKDTQAWEESKAIARRIFWGYSPDITRGALWYHARYVRPSWRKLLVRGPVIGQHIFYYDRAPAHETKPVLTAAYVDDHNTGKTEAPVAEPAVHVVAHAPKPATRAEGTERAIKVVARVPRPQETRRRNNRSLWLRFLDAVKKWLPERGQALLETATGNGPSQRPDGGGQDAT